jgi:hypothetical protein
MSKLTTGQTGTTRTKFLLLLLIVISLLFPVIAARAFVNLTRFEIFPETEPSQMRIEWETAVEQDNAGFLIYRGTSPGAWCDFETEAVEVVDVEDGQTYAPPLVIPPKGDALLGASYEFLDENVDEMTWYYYFLQDIELDGTLNCNGPIMVGIGLFTDTPEPTNTPTATETPSPTAPPATATSGGGQATATSGSGSSATVTLTPSGNSGGASATSPPSETPTATPSPEASASESSESTEEPGETSTEISSLDATLTALIAQVATEISPSPTAEPATATESAAPVSVADTTDAGSASNSASGGGPDRGLLVRLVLTFALFGLSAIILSGAVLFYMRRRSG